MLPLQFNLNLESKIQEKLQKIQMIPDGTNCVNMLPCGRKRDLMETYLLLEI